MDMDMEMDMGSEPSAIRDAAAAQSLRPALRPAQGHGPTLGPTLLEQQRASAASCASTTLKLTPPPAAVEAPIPYRPLPIAAPPSPPPPRAREAPTDPAADSGLAQGGLDTTQWRPRSVTPGETGTDAASKGLADYDQVTHCPVLTRARRVLQPRGTCVHRHISEAHGRPSTLWC